MPTHQAMSLDASGFDALAGRLGDTPETTIAVHLLRRRLCSAYALGEPGRPDALVIQPTHLPEEPMAYGSDVGAIGSILRGLRGWTCINVDVEVARHLGPLMEADLGRAVRMIEDVYHTLDRPVAGFPHPAVRSLGPDDQALLAGASADLREMALGFGSPDGLLSEGVAAGAVVDGAWSPWPAPRPGPGGMPTWASSRWSAGEAGGWRRHVPPSSPTASSDPAECPSGARARTTLPRCRSPGSWASVRSVAGPTSAPLTTSTCDDGTLPDR